MAKKSKRRSPVKRNNSRSQQRRRRKTRSGSRRFRSSETYTYTQEEEGAKFLNGKLSAYLKPPGSAEKLTKTEKKFVQGQPSEGWGPVLNLLLPTSLYVTYTITANITFWHPSYEKLQQGNYDFNICFYVQDNGQVKRVFVIKRPGNERPVFIHSFSSDHSLILALKEEHTASIPRIKVYVETIKIQDVKDVKDVRSFDRMMRIIDSRGLEKGEMELAEKGEVDDIPFFTVVARP